MDTLTKTSSFKCKYCERSFSRERTLETHLCEPKRRYAQKEKKGVQLGLMAFQEFYRLTQGTDNKTYDEFAKSRYYNAFVKFGYYLFNTKVIDVDGYIKHVINNGIKIDKWATDKVYGNFLLPYLKNETFDNALTRSIKTMQTWSEETGIPLSEFFNQISTNRLIHYITTGRISPWAIYNCNSGHTVLNEMAPEELGLLDDVLDVRFWFKKFDTSPKEVDDSQDILKGAGL